ncbi:MAG: SUMF1/EgtB/PvdO family nonheme iron enzyme [Myxococcota bacterium]
MKQAMLIAAGLLGTACGPSPNDQEPAPTATVAMERPLATTAPSTASRPGPSATVTRVFPPTVPAASQRELLRLVGSVAQAERSFLLQHVDVGGPGRMNQGNPARSHHLISREQCEAGLKGRVLQTPAQRAQCRGHENMVPIFTDGKPETAEVCMDIFEFPNRRCELPFVWSGATIANEVCKRLGKRLCRQEEWMVACGGDPTGGEARRYAYGEQLDLAACNTSKRARELQAEGPCDPRTVKSTWETCVTGSERSGAFPGCRSRFGVYDLHGNVAEAMTRFDFAEGKTVSQFKGSAFFYVDVQREVGEEPTRETYPDHCRHDPRWHVQPMDRAWHVNYHLGFRCCLDLQK